MVHRPFVLAGLAGLVLAFAPAEVVPDAAACGIKQSISRPPEAPAWTRKAGPSKRQLAAQAAAKAKNDKTSPQGKQDQGDDVDDRRVRLSRRAHLSNPQATDPKPEPRKAKRPIVARAAAGDPAAARAKNPPVEPIPVTPGSGDPSGPVVEAPVQPVVEASADPVAAPAQPAVVASTDPAVVAPVQPAVDAPVQPVVVASTDPAVDAAGNPAAEASVEPAVAKAQSWLGTANSLIGSVAYTYSYASTIDGLGGYITRHHEALVELEYVLPNPKFAVRVSVPFMAVQFDKAHSGSLMHTVQEWDDGNYHFTPQDGALLGTYEILSTHYLGWAVTAGISTPLAGYAAEGYADAGRHLTAGLFQTHVAGLIVPGLYYRVLYEFAKVQHLDISKDTAAYNQDHSRIEAFLGYAITDKLGVNVTWDALYQHDGIELKNLLMYSESVIDEHDRLLKESVSQLGFGASYRLTEEFELGLVVRLFVDGANTREANMAGVVASYRIL